MDRVTATQRGYLDAVEQLRQAWRRRDAEAAEDAELAMGVLLCLMREDARRGIVPPRSASVLGAHRRWHVNRGIVSPHCEFCRAVPGASRGSRQH